MINQEINLFLLHFLKLTYSLHILVFREFYIFIVYNFIYNIISL